jgi:hypothetical protein
MKRGGIQSLGFILMLLLLQSGCLLFTSALEATFTPADEKDGGAGPLPLSLKQRQQLLQLESVIVSSPDPASTLDQVAQQNGMSSNDLAGMLTRNRDDLRESGQLDAMLKEVSNAAAMQGSGRGGGGGVSASLPRRIVSILLSIIVTIIRMASVHASRHPGQLTILLAILSIALLAMHNVPRNGIVISSGTYPPFIRGKSTVFMPPITYLDERHCVGWSSSLPKHKKGAGSKGVGMTRSLKINTSSGSNEDDQGVYVESSRKIDGFKLVTTATTIIDFDDTEEVDEDVHDEDENEVQLEAAMSILDERRFSEFIPGPMLKFRSFLVPEYDDDGTDVASDEGAVLAMGSLGSFRRYGIQPFCKSYDETTSGSDVHDYKSITRCVAFHTLIGGHFDGELRFSIEKKQDDDNDVGISISVTLAIPSGGRAPSNTLAEELVSSLTRSIAQSSRTRTKQLLARRRQSQNYRDKSSGRASLKRHLRYEQEKAQEEMAAERKRKWKRNNPDAGHYRASGNMMKGPGGAPSYR